MPSTTPSFLPPPPTPSPWAHLPPPPAPREVPRQGSNAWAWLIGAIVASVVVGLAAPILFLMALSAAWSGSC